MSRHAALRARYRVALSILFLFTLPWLAIAAHAAEDCAGNAQQLIQYLNKAETQATPYTIKLVAGTYTLTGNKRQWIFSARTKIDGGYASGCSSQATQAADATTINSVSLPGLGLILSSAGDLEVDGIRFVGGNTTELGGGELLDPGNLKVANSHFMQTRLRLFAQNGELDVRNVLADHPPPDPIDRCSISLLLSGSNTAQLTFVSVDTSVGDDTCFETNTDAHHNTIKLFNSIFWNSDNAPSRIKLIADDWYVGDVFDVVATNSIFQNAVATSGGTFTEIDSKHTDPLWRDPTIDDYRLQEPPLPMSPAINAGAAAALIPGGISAAETDVAGNPRVIGSLPDIGAYESTIDDGTLFGVTTATDCSTPLNQPSCGSLRDAIARANAPTATAPVKTIKFWIIDWMNQPICPAVISVNSSLPDITTNIVVDGYSQGSIDQIDPPLSWENTDPYAFNASLCINIVGPGSGVGFRVPAGSSGSLTLRGVGLGGFSQGVMLLGGANHQIAGNQLGGTTSNGVDLHGFSAHAINLSPTVQPSGALIVGGDNPADKNVILDASSGGGIGAHAIYIGATTVSDPDHCQIIGNLVGILPNGMSAPGNDYGLILTGDGCTVRNNWIAGNTLGAIWLQGQHYVVQSNYIGVAPLSFVPQLNGGFGVLVSGSNNVVGAPVGDFVPPTLFELGLGNYVSDIPDGGIVVAAPGVSDTLRGNLVVNSGNATGNPANDLGDDGPTDNDAGDADAGVNNLQNFPQPHGVAWTAPPALDATVNTTLETQPGFYNIDVYLGKSCDAHGRGAPGLWVGSFEVFVTDAAAAEAFSVPAKIPTDYFDPATAAISLTATSELDGSTSEIGTCMSIDTIFKDEFER